tara:strand:- start:617 stop:1564 length:948 start_codon:yes stop_codon:yes gene_type:complete
MPKGILIIGDIILDKYVYGTCDRLSPEAPIPVLNVTGQKVSLGGAANVANNVANLDSKAYLFGMAGKDEDAKTLVKLLNTQKINHDLIYIDELKTISKTRIIGNRQQIVRIDEETVKMGLTSSIIKKLLEKISCIIPEFHTIILSDYNKGMLSRSIINHICSMGRENGILVLVDPKCISWDRYNGASYITPNFKEFSFAINKKIKNEDKEIEKYGKKLLKKYNISNIVVTRAEKGISLINKKISIHFPTSNQNVYDVSGAGDTVIATIAYCLGQGIDIEGCLHWANIAAGMVIKKLGAHPIQLNELIKLGFNKNE